MSTGGTGQTHHSSHRPIMSKSVTTSLRNYFCISVHVSHVRILHEIEIWYSTMVPDCGSLLSKLTNIYLKTVKTADKGNFLSFKVQSLRCSGSSKLSESYLIYFLDVNFPPPMVHCTGLCSGWLILCRLSASHLTPAPTSAAARDSSHVMVSIKFLPIFTFPRGNPGNGGGVYITKCLSNVN